MRYNGLALVIDLAARALQDHLRRTLPDHMVPSAYVPLAALPVELREVFLLRELEALPYDQIAAMIDLCADGHSQFKRRVSQRVAHSAAGTVNEDPKSHRSRLFPDSDQGFFQRPGAGFTHFAKRGPHLRRRDNPGADEGGLDRHRIRLDEEGLEGRVHLPVQFPGLGKIVGQSELHELDRFTHE